MSTSSKVLDVALDLAERGHPDLVARLTVIHFEVVRLERVLVALAAEANDVKIAPVQVFRQIALRQGAGTRPSKSSNRRLSDGE